MTEKYDNGNCAKWYYNTSNNITDGENEYTVHRKEPVTYLDGEILHGTNDLLDRLNEYECEVEQLKQSHKEILKDLEVTTFDKELLQKEIEQLKKDLEYKERVIKQYQQSQEENMKYCEGDVE